MDPPVNVETQPLDYGIQNILLPHVPLSLREDLGEIEGMKNRDNKIPYVLDKICIGGSDSERKVEIQENSDGNTRYWVLTPNTCHSRWEDVDGNVLNQRTDHFDESVNERTKKLLTHLLDREGTVVKVLDMANTPPGLHLENSIRIDELTLGKVKDFALLENVQRPINTVLLTSPFTEAYKCEAISTAKDIVCDTEAWENLHHYNPSSTMAISAFRTEMKLCEMVILVKNFMTRSRPSGLDLHIYFKSPQTKNLLMARIVADEEIDCKESVFENKSGHIVMKNGQNIFIYTPREGLRIKFMDQDIERNIPVPVEGRLLPRVAIPREVAPSVPRPVPERTIDAMIIRCQNGEVKNVTVPGKNALAQFVARGSSRTVINNLKIKGYCRENPLGADVVLARNLILLSDQPYPKAFFETFSDEPFLTLTVSSKATLRNGQKLLKNVRDAVTYLDDVPAEGHEEDETAGPAPKKMKMSS